MRDHSSSTLNTTMRTRSTSINRNSRANVLDIHYNENLKDFLKVTEFKEFKLNQKQEYAKNDDSDTNNLYIEDIDLRDILKGKEFPDKDFNIVNSFLKIEEEEILNIKNNNDKNNNDENEDDKNIKNIDFDEEDCILNQVNNKLFKDDDFQPGLFTSFDFKDRIKSLINIFLNNNNININFLNKNNEKNLNDFNDNENDDIKSKIDDSFI